MMRKLNRFMEHFWLAVFIGTALATIWAIATMGFAEGMRWGWFPAIALAMFFFRRFTRRRLEMMEDRTRGQGT